MPTTRLTPNIVGCKRIQASLGHGVFQDIVVQPHPLDLNSRGFFVPSKEQSNIPELDLPFERMMRWRCKDSGADRVLEIQMENDWVTENSNFLSIALTVSEETYGTLVKLLELNNVEFLLQKASYVQQQVTSVVEASAQGEISDRHKNELWNPNVALESGSSMRGDSQVVVEDAGEPGSPKAGIESLRLDAPTFDPDTSSPAFEEPEQMAVVADGGRRSSSSAIIPPTTLLDMEFAPLEEQMLPDTGSDRHSGLQEGGQAVAIAPSPESKDEIPPSSSLPIIPDAIEIHIPKVSVPAAKKSASATDAAGKPGKPWMLKKVIEEYI